MTRNLLVCACILSAAYVGTVLSHGLISQSAIYQCDWGDETEPTAGAQTCKQKFVVSMAISSGQGEVESLYANVDKAYKEGDTEMSRLKKPFRLEMQKSEVLASYRAHYISSLNAKPFEVAFQRRGCLDYWNAKTQLLACRKQLDINGRPVWDSQGFCCRCEGVDQLYVKRGNYTCGVVGLLVNRGSAHCMQMHDLWYDVFELDPPMLQYNISLRLLEFNGVEKNPQTGQEYVNWTTVSSFSLTPAQTLSRSKNGKVVAELEGDLLGAQGPHDLSQKYLLIPSIRLWPNSSYPEQYTNGPSDWLLLDQHIADLSGTTCNKPGVSYSGFRRQPGKCVLTQQSCFTNQPLDYWHSDNIRRQRKRRGRFMVHNFGKVHKSSHPNNHSFILRFVHDKLHNSFVTFRIDASNLLFVYNVGKGRIVETYATDVQAMRGMGELTVEIENTGEITAEFSVSVMRCTGSYRIPAKTVSILPGKIANVTFKVQSFDNKGGTHECEVQLFDSQFNLLQTAKVNFKVKSTCFCYGACGCICDEDEALVCPTAPPIEIEGGPLAGRILVLILESIGAEGFIGFFGGLFLFLGFMKLSCGGIICCRKTKAQEYADRMKEKGAPPKGPQLVRCGGECRGAVAAQARFKRKVERLKQMGKSPHRLDDWRNTSYVCSCQSELVDIRFIHIIKALCFFYYCLFLPFVWLGKKVWWSVFRDTAAQKEKAERTVLETARKKSKLEKYGVIDLGDELKRLEEEIDGKPKSKESKSSTAKSKANEKAVTEAIDSLVTRKVKLPNGMEKSKKGKTKKRKEKKGPKVVSEGEVLKRGAVKRSRQKNREKEVPRGRLEESRRRVKTDRCSSQKKGENKSKSRSGGGKKGKKSGPSTGESHATRKHNKIKHHKDLKPEIFYSSEHLESDKLLCSDSHSERSAHSSNLSYPMYCSEASIVEGDESGEESMTGETDVLSCASESEGNENSEENSNEYQSDASWGDEMDDGLELQSEEGNEEYSGSDCSDEEEDLSDRDEEEDCSDHDEEDWSDGGSCSLASETNSDSGGLKDSDSGESK